MKKLDYSVFVGNEWLEAFTCEYGTLRLSDGILGDSYASPIYKPNQRLTRASLFTNAPDDAEYCCVCDGRHYDYFIKIINSVQHYWGDEGWIKKDAGSADTDLSICIKRIRQEGEVKRLMEFTPEVFRGNEDWAKWATIDSDGEIILWSEKPFIYVNSTKYLTAHNEVRQKTVGFGGLNIWKDKFIHVYEFTDGKCEVVNQELTTAFDILNAASGHMQDRATTYDQPEGERSMSATVGAFKCVTGIELTEEQGWLFMVLLKAVRSQQGAYRADSYEDGAAYFALAGESAARDRKCRLA